MKLSFTKKGTTLAGAKNPEHRASGKSVRFDAPGATRVLRSSLILPVLMSRQLAAPVVYAPSMYARLKLDDIKQTITHQGPSNRPRDSPSTELYLVSTQTSQTTSGKTSIKQQNCSHSAKGNRSASSLDQTHPNPNNRPNSFDCMKFASTI